MKYYKIDMGSTLGMDGKVRQLPSMYKTKEELDYYKMIGMIDKDFDIESLEIVEKEEKN